MYEWVLNFHNVAKNATEDFCILPFLFCYIHAFSYTLILCCALSCSQSSRLNDQRCAPPPALYRGPTLPDEDFFSLIVRSQAKRMNEQRVLLPSVNWTLNTGFVFLFCFVLFLFFSPNVVTCQFVPASQLPLLHNSYQTWLGKDSTCFIWDKVSFAPLLLAMDGCGVADLNLPSPDIVNTFLLHRAGA